MRPLIATLLLCCGLTVVAWWLPNRPVADATLPDQRLNSVSFAPYRAWQSPLTDSFASEAEADSDMALVARIARGIRTYAAIEGDYDTAALARRHGLKLWQGIWLGRDTVRNTAEIARGIDLARRYPDVIERVVVGNEVLLRRDLPVADLIAALDQVRAAVPQKVTYADVWEFWEKAPEIADHVDIVTIHLLPYWEDEPTGIDRAVAHVRATYRRMAERFPGRTIAIGETGWPSRGRARHGAIPSRVNEARFIAGFIAASRAAGFDYNLIEAFDQVWKYHNEGTMGANWGLFAADRTAKFRPGRPTIEDPRWRMNAALSIGLGLALGAFALASTSRREGVGAGDAGRPETEGAERKPGWAASLVVAAAFVIGTALAFARAQTSPDGYDLHLLLSIVINLAAQTALAMLACRRIALILLSPAKPVASRNGAQTVLALRALGRRRRDHAPSPGDGGGGAAVDHLMFLFVWTAAILQALLVVDSRYRDFPTASFAVPIAVTAIRLVLRDRPATPSTVDIVVAASLAGLALIGAAVEGLDNPQSLTWCACAILLAVPRLWPAARARRSATDDAALDHRHAT